MGRAVVTGRRYTASGSSRQGTPLPPCLLVLFLLGGAKAQGALNTTARLPSRRRLQPEYYGGGLVLISRFFQFELGSARVTVAESTAVCLKPSTMPPEQQRNPQPFSRSTGSLGSLQGGGGGFRQGRISRGKFRR